MLHTSFTRTARALAAVLTAALAVAACTSDSGSGTATTGEKNTTVLGDAGRAMTHESGTAEGTIDLAGTTSKYTSRWQGTFLDGRGIATGHLPGADRPELEARWTKGQIYVRRTTSAAQYGQSPVGQLTTVQEGTPAWTTVPATNVSSRVLVPFSPPDLVLALSANGEQTVSDGPEVGGVATRKVTVTGHGGLLFNWIGAKDAEVLLDAKDRARRITVSFGKDHVRVDVGYTKTAPTVEVPPAGDLVAKPVEAPSPIGPFRTVRTGTGSGVAWTLQMAPGRNGFECWRWSSTPPLAVVQPNYLEDTRCVAPLPTAADANDPAERVDFVLWTDGTAAPTAAVVAQFPSTVTQATLGYVGGRTETVPVTDGLLTWVGSSAEPLGYVGLQIDGTSIDCGVGAVSSAADLTNETLVGEPFHAPWTCQSN